MNSKNNRLVGKTVYPLTKLFPKNCCCRTFVKGPSSDRIRDRISRRRHPSSAGDDNNDDDDDNNDDQGAGRPCWVLAGCHFFGGYPYLGGSSSGNNFSWTVR